MVVIVLAAAEALLRVPSVRDALPARTHYYHPSITERLDELERVRARRGDIRVLFVGSSIVRTDINPRAFDRAVRLSTPVVSFNAAMDGIWPAGLELYVRHLWLDAARPQVVIQGIRYAELRVADAAKHDVAMWAGTIEAAWRGRDPFDRILAAATLRLRLLQYRGVLTTELQRWVEGYPGHPASPATVRGHLPRRTAARTFDPQDADLPNDGTCDDGGCGRGLIILRRTHEAVRAAGADYMLVNVPEHGSRWAGADGPRRYREYLATVRRFAEREDIHFVDPTDGDPLRFDGPEAFGDVSHMTAAAAVHFTEALAVRLRPALQAALQGAPARAPAVRRAESRR